MSVDVWGPLSNLAFASATVVYALALLAHAAEWAAARQVTPVGATEATRATATVGSPDARVTADATPPYAQPAPRYDALGRIGQSLTVLAFAAHLIGVVARGLAADRVPWGNMFEFSTTGALAVTGAYLVLLRRSRLRWLGLPVSGFVLLVMGLAMVVPGLYVAPGPLVPALHSYWLVIHVAAACVAGGAFTVGALTSLLYLLRTRAERRTPDETARRGYLWLLPSTTDIDRVAYRVHAFALPLWTFAVLAGAIWAEYAWGRYWGWDPKETWAFITWVVYAAYLHARATAGWQGRNAAIIALLGFGTFLFNFIGINLFASGLHSYAGV